MYKPVILHLAKTDIKEAATWYNERQPGLGKRFTTHVRERSCLLYLQDPEAIAFRYEGTRTFILDTFPYMIHFTIDENKKQVIIAAVLSTSRNPKMWKERS